MRWERTFSLLAFLAPGAKVLGQRCRAQNQDDHDRQPEQPHAPHHLRHRVVHHRLTLSYLLRDKSPLVDRVPTQTRTCKARLWSADVRIAIIQDRWADAD